MMRYWLLRGVVTLVIPISVWADGGGTPSDAAQERLRIERERTQANAMFIEQEQQCYSTWMVNSCLRDVRKRRIDLMSSLKRQETQLNDAQRMQQGQEQRMRMQEKATERAAQDPQALPTQGQSFADRQAAQLEKQQAHEEKNQTLQAEPDASRASTPTKVGPDEAELEAARAAHAQKLKDAHQRRLDRDARIRSAKPVKALPL